MYPIDLTGEVFDFLCTRPFRISTHENEKKKIPTGACFRDISLQNIQILRQKCIDVNVKRLFLAHVCSGHLVEIVCKIHRKLFQKTDFSKGNL